jgi:hypothetical protein
VSAPISTVRFDYEARSAAGTAITTFCSPEQASSWAEAKGADWPGYSIVRIRTTRTEVVLFEDSQAEVAA